MADAPSAAARFYKEDLELEIRTNAPGSRRTPEDVSRPSHRYFGAYAAIMDAAPRAVLELGAGYSGPTRAISQLGGFTYDVVDIVDHGEPALPAGFSAHTLNLDDDFPFADGQFDLVIALMVVEHLYDPFHALSEISRVLEPGGRLVMNLPNIAALRRRLEILTGRMPVTSTPDWFERRQWDGGHLHNFTVETVKRLCALYGLTVERMLPVGGRRAIKRLNIPLFCAEITFMCRKRPEARGS